MDKKPIENTSWAILLFLSLVWGCSFILIKKSLLAFDPVQLACLRLGISSLAFAPIVFWHRRDIDWAQWPKICSSGTNRKWHSCLLIFIAQTQISSSVRPAQ
ncbi:MAG: EamA family transporter [Saprospiraceae bacterium]|nr:EamA family transporter [Saprospiraceae bacterium]